MENEKFQAKSMRLLADRLEGMRIAEYVTLLQKPIRIIYLNFLAGVAKGLGIAIGATVVFALLLEVLSRLIMLNLPVIGDFIIEIMKIVEMKQRSL